MKILTTDFTDDTDMEFSIHSHPRSKTLLCTFIAMALLVGCGSEPDEARACAALPAAKKYMLTKMLSPASTVFVEAPLRPTHDSDGGFWIYTVMNAQNAHGALIRGGSWVRVVNTNGGWRADMHSNPAGSVGNPRFAPCLIISSNGAPGAAAATLQDYNYTVVVKNIGSANAVRNLDLQLNDAHGSQVDSTFHPAIGIPAGETVVFTGSVSVLRSEVARIKSVFPKLTQAE